MPSEQGKRRAKSDATLQRLAAEEYLIYTQLQVLSGAGTMKYSMLLIQGPPGTRKTILIAIKAVQLLYSVRHRVVIAAPTNKVVNNNVTEVWHEVQVEFARDMGYKRPKVLRLETTVEHKRTGKTIETTSLVAGQRTFEGKLIELARQGASIAKRRMMLGRYPTSMLPCKPS